MDSNLGKFKRTLLEPERFKTIEENHLVIQLVKMHPVLYDTNHHDYNLYASRKEAWNEICEQLYPDWNILTPTEQYDKYQAIMKRWKSFRDCYKRDVLRKVRGCLNFKRNYLYGDQLKFLIPFFKKGASTDPLVPPSQYEEFDYVESRDGYFENSENKDANYFKQFFSNDSSSSSEDDEKTDNESNHSNNQKSQENSSSESLIQKNDENDDFDDDRAFLLSLLPTLKSFNQQEKIQIRIELMNVIRNAQIRKNSRVNTPKNIKRKKSWSKGKKRRKLNVTDQSPENIDEDSGDEAVKKFIINEEQKALNSEANLKDDEVDKDVENEEDEQILP